jgi:hypothetical protein
MTMVTWDERKRTAVLRQHGLDFAGAEAVFDNPTVVAEDSRADYGEPRMNLLGWLEGRIVHMTYTERHEKLRVISPRKATKHEIGIHLQAISGER